MTATAHFAFPYSIAMQEYCYIATDRDKRLIPRCRLVGRCQCLPPFTFFPIHTMTSIPADLTLLADEALEAFWSTLVRHFPEATTGDLSPERTIGLQMAAEEAIKEWIENNTLVDSALRP